MTRVAIGSLEDFTIGEATTLRLENRTLVVVRIDDAVYVLDDRCSHEDFSLALGEVDVDECTIECARHGALFSLRDGSPQSLPATKAVAHYDVVDHDGVLEVVLP